MSSVRTFAIALLAVLLFAHKIDPLPQRSGHDGATDTAVAGRDSAATASLSDGRVLVAGGYNGSNSLSIADLYFPN